MITGLGRIPPHYYDLNIKATGSGIVFLKDSKFKNRYTGNKYCLVDPVGNLCLDANSIRKKEKEERDKKNPPTKKKGGENNLFYDYLPTASKENLPTPQKELLTENKGLSTKFRGYTINKQLVRQRILGYLNTMKGEKELYFWTVTFPLGLSDDTIYQIFNIWLTSLRQYKMLKEYVWIAERQKNGTIHYHIAVPHKMPVYKANAMMQGTLKGFAKKGLIPVTVHQCKRYNGVDIAKNRNTKRVTNFANKKGAKSLTVYLTKYITKNDGKFSRLAWHNSRGYSSIFTGVTFTVPEFINFGFHLQIDRRKRLDSEYFSFIPWTDAGPPRLLMDHLYKVNSYIQSVLN